jgi:hypothetical protein
MHPETTMNEFSVCPHGPCAAALAVREKELQQLLQAIEELMRRYREERHVPTYGDLLDLRQAGAGGAT